MEVIPQKVKVRKHEVDLESLKLLLKNYKIRSGLSNKQIAKTLKVPITMGEHWFRGDKSFSIPDENLWLDLKLILGIKEDTFDKQVMEFEIKDGVFEKSNRVYDEEGIAPTLTCGNAGNEKIKVRGGYMSEPRLIGGIGEINFGKQFRQGNRVYDSEEIAMCLLAQPVGNVGGYSYLYKINNKENKGRMWKNNLERFEFDVEEIKLFDSFCGIGSLHKALKKLGIPTKLVGVSEIDIDATISYAAIHIHNFKELEFEYPSVEEMRRLLIERNIGYDFQKEKSKVNKLKNDKLKLLYKATVLLNNLGDISIVKTEDIPDFDIFNMSFPCQSFSIAGKRLGVEDLRGTLGFASINMLKDKKPKYFMIENVPGLISIDKGETIKSMLRMCCENGYRIKSEVLNSKNYGIPQNRSRLFVMGVRKDGL